MAKATAPALVLGTRGSALALAQAGWVAELLDGAEVVPVQPSAAETGSQNGGRAGDKGRFVSGVERMLLAGEVDLGVHSAKDVPGEMTPKLTLAGVPQREEPRDAYVGPAASLDEVPSGARIGTSSLRRRSQLLALRPDLRIEPLRGNVDTRLGRLKDGDYDGVVLAAAGLARLGRQGQISFLFEPDAMTPAPGQGALALQARAGDESAQLGAAGISDETALVELTAERAAVQGLEASCDTPLGVLARRDGERLAISGYAGLPDGSEWIRDTLEGPAEDPIGLGRELAARMASSGARDIFERAHGEAS
jgi:hydroxymethylbilane synthase